MKDKIKLRPEYNSLDKLLVYLTSACTYTCVIDYDSWDLRTDANGEMEKCIIIKKSAMHGMKVYFNANCELIMTYMIPNKLMHAYFGRSVKAYKNILEIIAGGIKNGLLANSQKKAFEEIKLVLTKIAVL